MPTPTPIEIFRVGRHTAMSGYALDFSDDDLRAMVAAYDPSIYDAPIVVGHPKLNAPAYGWIGALSFAGDIVSATPRDVDPEFAELVRSKKFKKVSASFFTPDSTDNPKPGTYYLRHVGFLGAMPPAVKGLKEASFAENESGVVEFSVAEFSGEYYVASLFRRLRDWMIGTQGQEAADVVLPGWEIDSLNEMRVREETQNAQNAQPAHFADPTPKGDEMSDEDKARLAALEAENAALKQAQADFAEAETKRRADEAHAAHLSFADGLVAEGRLLPADKATAVAALDLVAAQGAAPVEFGEGDGKTAVTLDGLKTFFKNLPKQVDFTEHAGGAGDTDSAVSFAAPAGYEVDAGALELHRKAQAYRRAHADVSYIDAIKAVR